ncbi:Tify domain [Forsythia ovata]|uniref:Tify domain n=1 Tax=Forsythia ovata TaxID=205694 RepID=A0ABD1TQT4_9LAMI
MTSAVALASGKGGADQLTLSFQGEVYGFDYVSLEKVCCVSRFDSANVNANASASSSGFNDGARHVGRARYDWPLSSCAILAKQGGVASAKQREKRWLCHFRMSITSMP